MNKYIIRYSKNIYHFIIKHIIPWQIRYFIQFCRFKRFPNLFNPQDYSVYIFRDCLLKKNDKRAFLADKFEVRKFIEQKGLSKLLTKLYGVWDNADEIDFESLPNQFAIKCNHSCGMNIICYNKDALDVNKTKQQLNKWLETKHEIAHEHHYKKIKPLIICEELIPNNKDGCFPMDYKIHCANGKPIFIQCCFERTSTSAGRRVIYSPEWEDMHFVIKDQHYTNESVPKPKHLQEMLEYASLLSEGMKYVRIDLYDTDDRVIFGEITLTPMGGWLDYFSQDALNYMGNAIKMQK